MALRYRLTTHRFTPPFRKTGFDKLMEDKSNIREQADDVRLFRGVFGVQSNDLLTMAAWSDTSSVADITLPGSDILETNLLTPTARPKAIGQLPKGGIYVLRRFQINEADLDEFVALSDEAWVSMEASFGNKIIGLFCTDEAPAGKITMLLYTWYASHAEWEISRDARPEAGAAKAWQNFLRRHELTDFTHAIVVSEVSLD